MSRWQIQSKATKYLSGRKHPPTQPPVQHRLVGKRVFPPRAGWEFYLKVLPLLGAFGAAFWSGTLYEHECCKDKDEFLVLQRDDLKSKLTSMDELRNKLATANSYIEECKRGANGTDAVKNAAQQQSQNLNTGEIDAQVFEGDTLNVSHKLYLTVVAITPLKSPSLRYQASATLGAPELKSESFQAFAGDVKTFAVYEIRVTKVDPVSVWFHIRKDDREKPPR